MSGRGSELASCDVDVREVERGLPYPLTSRYDRDTTNTQRTTCNLHRPMIGWFVGGSGFEVASTIHRYSVP